MRPRFASNNFPNECLNDAESFGYRFLAHAAARIFTTYILYFMIFEDGSFEIRSARNAPMLKCVRHIVLLSAVCEVCHFIIRRVTVDMTNNATLRTRSDKRFSNQSMNVPRRILIIFI